MITVTSMLFVFLTHKYNNSAFCSWILFFHCLNLFQDFLPNQTHIPKISFWFLETQGSTIGSIYELLLLSRAPHDSIDNRYNLLSCSFLLCNIRTEKISYSKNDIFQSAP